MPLAFCVLCNYNDWHDKSEQCTATQSHVANAFDLVSGIILCECEPRSEKIGSRLSATTFGELGFNNVVLSPVS